MRHLYLAIMLLLALATICQATTLSLQATSDEDAWSSDGWQTVGMDYSAAHFVSDDLYTLYIYLGDVGEYEIRSALEFSIATLPSNSVVESATLYLRGIFYDANIAVHAYDGDGEVNASDFLLNELGTQITTFDPDVFNAIDVTNGVRSLYASGADFVGFQLRELVLYDPTMFASRLYSESSITPRLDIVFTPVPEPSTFILLGFGLAGLVAWRRKRS